MARTGDSAMSISTKFREQTVARKRTWRIVVAALTPSLVIAAGFVAAGCGNDADRTAAATESAPPAAVVKVTRADITEEFSTAAVFRPFQEISIYAKVPGYVRHINVDIGDRVRKGELLATLEVPELVANVDHAKAAVARGQEEL